MGKSVEIKKEGIFIPLKVLEGIGLGNFDLRESIFLWMQIFLIIIVIFLYNIAKYIYKEFNKRINIYGHTEEDIWKK